MDGPDEGLEVGGLLGVDPNVCNNVTPDCPIVEGEDYHYETMITADDLFAGQLIATLYRPTLLMYRDISIFI